jgi:tetratricopeptide (TPR) repeat protein
MAELARAYSYRWIHRPAELIVDGISQVSLATSTDQSQRDDIETLIDLGNQLINRRQYRRALRNFLRAYAMLARLINRQVKDCLVASPIFGAVDLTPNLLAAGVEIARLRAEGRWESLGVVSPIDPPPEVREVLAGIDPRLQDPRNAAAIAYLDGATANVAAGMHDRALTLARHALGLNPGPALAGQLRLIEGTALGAQRQFGPAERALDQAREALQQAGRLQEAVLAGQNADTVRQARGNPIGRALRGIVNFFLPREPGTLNLALTDAEGRQLTVSGAESVPVLRGEITLCLGPGVRTLTLDDNSVGALQAMLYADRVAQADLGRLRLFDGTRDNVTAALPHLYHFVLPMAIGECYLELGQHGKAEEWFIQASQYRHLNAPVEVPLVWEMLAETYLRWGHALLREGERVAARAQYARIARPGSDPVDPASPLYRSPRFDVLAQEARALVQGAGAARPAVAIRVRLARLNITAIDSGVDLPLLSLAREQIPVFRFEYLQQVARYMAEQAIRAETAFINFQSAAEDEAARRLMLEDAVALAEANVALEDKMVDVADAQVDATEAQRDSVVEQRQNAQQARDQYAAISWDLASLDALQAWIGRIGAGDEIRVTEGWGAFGLDTGERKAADVAFDVSFRRSEINREWELDQMQRGIDNLAAAEAAANANLAVAEIHADAARARRDIAALRHQQAQDQRAAFEAELFTPEVWERLAREVREIAREYVERAIAVARLLEEVFEFEIGEPLSIIRPTYLTDPISGMLAGHRLLADIDGLEIARIATAKKHHPLKMVVSLAERFPFLFARQFQQTGRMDFTLPLTDLDWAYPGTYQGKIKRVEVVVEGLVGPRGVRGALTNTGFGYTRRRDGRIQLRLLAPETMPLSEYTIAGDVIVFPVGGRELASFELAPVATSWRLEIPPRANDIDYRLIRDVKLVVYFEALYEEGLRDEVILELLDTVPTRHQITYDLGFEFPDSFFLLRDTGEVRFEVVASHLPFNHDQARVERVSFLLATEEGESPDGLTVEVTSPAPTPVTDVTANDGQIATAPGAPLEALQGDALLGVWRVAIPQAANQARFDAGFTWARVTHILMTVDYRYTRRPYPGDPQAVVDDDFAADPLANFDVVDDPAATQGAPSDWRHDAAQQRVIQRAGIFGPAGAAGNSPDKPGTYLVHRATPAVPALRDLLLSATVVSADGNGVGFVFRYADPDNFYFFLMDAQRTYRRLGKRIGGVFRELDSPAVDVTRGFTANTPHRVKIVARGHELRAYLDNELILGGRDGDLQAPGRFGFYSWRSQDVAFDDLRVFQL